jgi:hypothetical protein
MGNLVFSAMSPERDVAVEKLDKLDKLDRLDRLDKLDKLDTRC